MVEMRLLDVLVVDLRMQRILQVYFLFSDNKVFRLIKIVKYARPLTVTLETNFAQLDASSVHLSSAYCPSNKDFIIKHIQFK